MTVSRNAPCPCGSGRRAKSCCAPILDGAPAPTPEALMRSRYTAYATRDAAHLMATTAPGSPHRGADPRAWREDLLRYCDAVRFLGLTVFGATEDGDRGEVRFFARISVDGADASFGEHSRFARVGGRWAYLDGTRIDADGRPIVEGVSGPGGVPGA
ncbi:MAG: YchJ family metal-binding protein [Myxococcota bacterium]